MIKSNRTTNRNKYQARNRSIVASLMPTENFSRVFRSSDKKGANDKGVYWSTAFSAPPNLFMSS